MLVSSNEVCKVADMALLREVDKQEFYMAHVSPTGWWSSRYSLRAAVSLKEGLEECSELLTVDLAQFVPGYSLVNTYIKFTVPLVLMNIMTSIDPSCKGLRG